MIDTQSIASKFSPEIALAILFLRLKLGKANANDLHDFLSNNSIDINKFLLLIEAHQIESIIYSLQAFRNFLPENEDVINFKYRVEYRSRFNMVLLDELIALNRLFKGVEFPIYFYKGVMLSKLLFDDFTTRTTADIDILI